MPKLSFIGVAAAATLLFAAAVLWAGSTPQGVAAQGTPACPSSWPGATGTDTRSSIGYQDYYTDSDGQNWFIIRSTDSNGYTTVRAYPANADSSAYITDSADQVCYLIVRRPGDSEDVAAAAARSQQIIFPSDNDDGANQPTMTTSNITQSSAMLTINNYTGTWHYQYTSPSGGSGSAEVTGNTANVSGLTPNTTYTYTACGDSQCTTTIASGTFRTASSTAGGSNNPPTPTPTPIPGQPTPTPTPPSLSASNVTATTATLTIANHSGDWYYKSTDTNASCSSVVSTTTANITGLTKSTEYTYTAYSDSGCATAIGRATATFTTNTPALAASGVIHDSATLKLSGWAAGTGAGKDGSWYYWYYTGTATCATSSLSSFTEVSAGQNVTVSSLDVKEGYTFKVYDARNCNDEIVTATFTTLAPPIVSNLSQPDNREFGVSVPNTTRWATAFTTGSRPGGYTLEKVAVKFGNRSGGINVSIYNNSNGLSGNIADHPGTLKTTLSGPGSPNKEIAVYSCSSSCGLSASTTYHLVLESSGNSGHHQWRATNSNGETSSQGASVGDSSGRRVNIGPWNPTASNDSGLFAVYASGTTGTSAPPSLIATSSFAQIKIKRYDFEGDWAFKVGGHSCTQAGTGDTVTIGGYTGTQTIRAYNDTTCSNEVASDTILVQIGNASLTATSGSNQINLTLTNGPSNWWFSISGGSCTAVTGSTYNGIGGYSGTHTINAYSDSCYSKIASATVTVQ